MAGGHPHPGGEGPGALRLLDRHGDRMHDLALAMLGAHADAVEVVRDVLCEVDVVPGGAALPGSADADADADAGADAGADVRTWLYARTRQEVLTRLSAVNRPPADARVVAVPPVGGDATAGELGGVVWAALAAFDDTDTALLVLHLRHGLSGRDLAHAVGLSEAATDLLLARAVRRTRAEVGLLLALLGVDGSGADGSGGAPTGPAASAVAGLAAGWDGTFSPWVRRHAAGLDEAVVAALPDAVALLRAVPLVPAPSRLRHMVAARLDARPGQGPGPEASTSADAQTGGGVGDLLLDDTIPPELAVPTGAVPVSPAPASAPPPPSPSSPPSPSTSSPRRPGRASAVLGVALGLAIALVLAALVARAAWDREDDAAVVELTTEPIPEVPARPTVPVGAVDEDDDDRPFFQPPPTALPGAPATGATAGSPTTVEDPVVGPGAPGPAGEPGPAATTTPRTSMTAPSAVAMPPDGSGAVVIGNPGPRAVRWRLTAIPEWLRAMPTTGILTPGADAEVVLVLRDDLAEGDYAEDLQITGRAEGGADPVVLTVEVSASVDRAPVVADVDVGSRVLTQRGCGLDATDVVVVVEEEGTVAQVTLVASTSDGAGPDGHVEVRLREDPASPGRWTGRLGPFQRPGVRGLAVTAVDRRGNTGGADGGSITVAPCPAGTGGR